MNKQINSQIEQYVSEDAVSGGRVRRAWAALLRLDTTPHALGLGLATGVFVAFLPVLGIQMLVAVAIAWLGRANVGAAVLGTWAGNPLTWPAMWIGSYLLGIMLLGEASAMTIDELQHTLVRLSETPNSHFGSVWAPLSALEAVGKLLWPILKPLLVGSLVLGLISGAALYFIGRRAAEVFNTRRQEGV